MSGAKNGGRFKPAWGCSGDLEGITEAERAGSGNGEVTRKDEHTQSTRMMHVCTLLALLELEETRCHRVDWTVWLKVSP